ncbi:phosphotransferase enzyme family protein [Hirsutella rhossiliensis]
MSLNPLSDSFSFLPIVVSVDGGTVQDRFFKPDYEEGPFHTIKFFNDWLLAAATGQRPAPDGVAGPYRDFFPDSGNISFTHGDLTLGNIVVSGIPGSQTIVGITDWGQAGWYPQYWEYCKLLYGVEYTHGWLEAGWADQVMEPFDDEWTAFAEYSLWRCP